MLTTGRCDCPPTLSTFVGAVEIQVANGQKFPTGESDPYPFDISLLTIMIGSSVADQLTRLQTCIVALQNFKGGPGSGVGCPAVSTTWKELQAKLQSQAK